MLVVGQGQGHLHPILLERCKSLQGALPLGITAAHVDLVQVVAVLFGFVHLQLNIERHGSTLTLQGYLQILFEIQVVDNFYPLLFVSGGIFEHGLFLPLSQKLNDLLVSLLVLSEEHEVGAD